MQLLAKLTSSSHLRTIRGALLALSAVTLPWNLHAQAPGRTDWNAARDLILNEKPDGGAQETANPNATVPQWSYGYRQGVTNTNLTLYTAAEHVNLTDGTYAGLEGYGDAARQYGLAVSPNGTLTVSNFDPLAADELFTSVDDHSTSGNNVVRWTCPADGTYSYQVSWHDLDPNGGDGAAGYVVVNGALVFDGHWPNGRGQGATASGTLALKAGDVFDVLLNANSTDSSYDTAGTRIVITPGSVAPVSDKATVTVPGTSNLWLAGAAPGTTASAGQDNLANATPFQVPNLKITPGTTMTFRATGNVSNDPAMPVAVGPDGGPYLGTTFYGHDKENGISNVTAPINSLIGVFLGDAAPSTTVPPDDGYDFSQGVGTIYVQTAPALGKPFFIGDGLTADGTQQQVYVPPGATRLFLGSLDPSDQENNAGSFVVKINGGVDGGTGTITSRLADKATVGLPYSYLITVGGFTPTHYLAQLQPSGLPPGLVVDTFSGVLSGTPTQAGTYPLTLFASDDAGHSATATLTLTVAAGTTTPPPVSTSPLVVTDTTYSSGSDATGATAVPGDKLTYGFTVRNTGDTALTNIVVTTVLNGIKLKGASDGGALNPANKTQAVYPAFGLAPHTSKVLTFTAKVPGDFPLDGRIVGLGFSGIKSDTVTADLSGTPGLNSTVLPPYQTSVSYNAVVKPGDLLTFTFQTTNLSKEKISGLTSVIHLPDGTTFKNAKNASGAALAIQPDGSGNLSVALPDLGANQSVTYSVSVTLHADLAPDAVVTLDRTQLVTANGATTYNEAGAKVTLSGQAASSPPQLAISKRIVDQFTLAGLFIFYPQRAALLAAAFPQYQLYVPDPATGQPTANPTEISRLGAALNPYTGSDDAGSATGGPIRTVIAPNAKQPATYVTFALFYENDGGSKATDLTVTDRVPQGFAYVPDAPASDTPGNLLAPPYALINGVAAIAGKTLTVTDNGRTLNFTVKNNLKPGQFGLIAYQLRVVPTIQGGPNPGAIVDTPGARITTSSLGSDVLAKPDGEPVLVTAPLHLAYQLVLPTNNQGSIGTPAAFQFFYKNDGGKKTNDLRIKVAVPKGTTFAGASVVSGAGSVSQGADGTTFFSIGKVKPGQGGVVEARFTPTADVFNPAVNPSKGVNVQFVLSPDGTFSDASAVVGRRPVTRAAVNGQPQPRALPIDTNPLPPVVFHPITDPTAPRLFIQRSAPLVAEQGKGFYYQIVVGNLGDRPADHATVTDVLPKGLDLALLQGDATQPAVVSRGDRVTYTITFSDPILAHGVRSLKFNLRASTTLYGGSGDVTATDDTLYVTSTAQPYQIYCPPVTTRLLRSNETVALVGAQAISEGLQPYGFDATSVNTVAKAVTTNSRITTVGGADVLTTNQGAVIIPLGTSAGATVGKGLGPVLVSGPAGVVANVGANLISQDGSGLVAAGAGNLIQVNGLIGNDGTGLRVASSQLAGSLASNLISQDGSGLVAAGAGNLIRGGGLNLVPQSGLGLISNDGSGLISQDGSGLVAAGAGNIVATRLIGQDGTGLVAAGAGNLVAAGAGNLLANSGGHVIATGGGNITSGGAAGVLGSAPNTAALVAAGAGNLIGVSGGVSQLVAAGAGN